MNRKAADLDVPGIEFLKMGTLIEHRPLSDQDRLLKITHAIHCTVVRVEGGRIRLDGGWTFIGTLEHTPAGNILRAVPDQTIPDAYRLVKPVCDHCQLARKRKDTYIVRDESGAYLQVGRTCLRDYLGHRNPALVAAWLEHLAELGTALVDDDYWNTDIHETGYSSDYFLGMTAAAIRLWGWTSRSKASDYNSATADTVQSWIEDARKSGLANNGLADRDGHLAYTPGDKPIETCDDDFSLARAALAWIRSQEDDQLTNGYMWNLFVACQMDAFTFKQLGIAASLIPAYQRTIADKLERLDTPESQWLGTIRKRQMWVDLLLVDVKYWENDWGVTYFHKFQDLDGNILIWKTGTVELDQGSTYQGKATVKAHDVYRDIKQTVLARAAFDLMEGQE